MCLDLEKVLIGDWFEDRSIRPSTKILLEEYGVTGGFPVEIFSFAVDNRQDYDVFCGFSGRIERFFDINITDVVLVEELMSIHFHQTAERLRMWEYKMRGKTLGFMDYVEHRESVKEDTTPVSYILFDDNVADQDILLDNCSVHFIRVE